MKRLRMLREKKQLTQSQLGKLTDISPSAIGTVSYTHLTLPTIYSV